MRVFGGILGAAMAWGCTLVSDFEIQQCVEDDDCQPSRDAPVRICEAQRCVAGCADNGQCDKELSGGGAAYWMCPTRGAECVNLLSSECFGTLGPEPSSLGTLRGEDLALIGLFAAPVPGAQPTPAELTYRLAISDLNEEGGLPGIMRPPRPVVGVICDDTRAATDAGIAHLVDRLGVRAVLAALEPEPLRAAVEGQDPSVFFLSPFLDPGPVIARTDALWYLFDEQAAIAPAYVPLLARVQDRLARERQVAPEAVRMALVVSTESDADADRRLKLAVERELGGAMASQAELLLGRNAEEFGLGAESELGGAVEAIIAYQPDVVLLFASGNFASGRERSAIVTEIERGWLTGAQRPLYVGAPANFDTRELTALGEDADFRRRFVGLNAYREFDGPLARNLADAYESFENRDTRFAAAANLYDAVYYLAYALSAAYRPEIADQTNAVFHGFQSITDLSGERVEVGPLGKDAAFEHLYDRKPFALHGVTGPPDFDPVTHHRPSGASGYCLVEQERQGKLEVLWDVQAWAYEASRRGFVRLPPLDPNVPDTRAFCLPELFDAEAK